MQNITIKQGQSFLDAVLEGTGDISNAFVMAQANGCSITDAPAIGTGIEVAGNIKANMVALLTGKYAPATLGAPPEFSVFDFVFPLIFPIL